MELNGLNRIEIESTPTPIESDSCDRVIEEKVWSKQEFYDQLKTNEMNLNDNQKEKLKTLLWKFRSCFSVDSSDLGVCNMFQAEIELQPDAKPKYIANRPIAYALRPVVAEQIKTQLASGVIEEYYGNSEWNSPIMVVRKPHSDDMRFVSDGRYLNSQTKPDNYPLPTMQRVLDELKECTYLSSMDITSSFNQIPLAEKSRHLTAFTYNKRRFVFRQMVMGLKQSSAKFCRMIDKLFGPVIGLSILLFIDDILVGSDTVEDHLSRLEFVFEKLESANLKLKPSKCHLFRKEVSFIGYTVSKEGIKIDNSRIQPILELKPPTNKKGVQSIIGLFNFNRQFIPKFSEKIKPLYNLLKKDVPFEWSEECQLSLDVLKDSLTTSPVLAIPDIDDRDSSFRVECDSSGLAWGGVLSQVIKGERRIIAYYSKNIPNYKRKLGASRLEFLGMYHCLKHWKPYLIHNETEVVTDCSALTNLELLFRRSSRVQQRQMEELADFRLKIRHKAGKDLFLPDFLSRYNYENQTKSIGCQTEEPHNSGHVVFNIDHNIDDEVSSIDDKVSNIDHEIVFNIDHNIDDEVSSIDDKVSNIDHEIATNIDHNIDDEVSSIDQESTPKINVEVASDTIEKSESNVGEIDMVSLIDTVRYGSRGYTSLEPIKEEEELVIDEWRNNQCYQISSTITEETALGEGEYAVYDTVHQEREIAIVTLSDVVEETAKDPVLSTVVEWVKAGEKPRSIQNRIPPRELVSLWKSFSRLTYKNGILYKKWVNVKPPLLENQLIVVPYTLQERVLTYYHCGVLSIHAGVEACWNNCVKFFWWSGMKNDFKLFIAACLKCQHIKQPRAYFRAPLHPMLYSEFGSCLSIDHIVPSSKQISADGNRYILTLVDNFTNFLVAVPVKTQTAEESVRCIIQKWCMQHGIPLRISHDLHRNFTSDLFTGILSEFQINDKRTTPFFSSGNGKAERLNGKLNAALRAVVPVNEQNTWDRYLPYVVSALNCLKSNHTGYSPNFLVYGREIRYPQQFFIDQEEVAEEGVLPRQTKAYVLHRLIKDTFYKVRQNAKQKAMFVKKQYDKKANLHVFEPGDHCFVYIDGNKTKFSARWKGPILIIKRLSIHNYVVLIDPAKQLHKVVNIQKLKPYIPNKFSPIRCTVFDNGIKDREQEGKMSKSTGKNIGNDKETVWVPVRNPSLPDLALLPPTRNGNAPQSIPPTERQAGSGTDTESNTEENAVSSGISEAHRIVEGVARIPSSNFGPIDPRIPERRPRNAHKIKKGPYDPKGSWVLKDQ